jgi:two-component sensor histidine kinase
MIGDYRPAALNVTSDGGSVTSREAVSLGLIVTELVLNASKHAFPLRAHHVPIPSVLCPVAVAGGRNRLLR